MGTGKSCEHAGVRTEQRITGNATRVRIGDRLPDCVEIRFPRKGLPEVSGPCASLVISSATIEDMQSALRAHDSRRDRFAITKINDGQREAAAGGLSHSRPTSGSVRGRKFAQHLVECQFDAMDERGFVREFLVMLMHQHRRIYFKNNKIA
jgi:hypothetical protein